MWRSVCASVVGSSHAVSATPCQDSGWAQTDVLPDGLHLLSIFVADGAGSALRGGDGAELAIEAAAACVALKSQALQLELDDALAVEVVQAVRDKILAAAASAQLRPRDFACTFLGMLATDGAALVFQIGDGGVVLDAGRGLELAITPMSGEYANMTRFVTDDDAMAILQTRKYAECITKVAAFTDGIQRLALHLADHTPHVPFFLPFFDGLAKASAEQAEQLPGLLVQFLGSPAVNERTDDDKTLALAVRLG